METQEIWKSLPNYPGVEISNLGRIKRLETQGHPEYIVSEFAKDRDGYCRVNVKRVDKPNHYMSTAVHRLVALAFIPNPENKSAVNHKNNNRTDNRVENLEWVTPKENVHHSYLYGNRKVNKEVPKTTVLTDFQISQISFLRQYYSLNQISQLFNIKYQTLKNITQKLTKRQRLDNQQPSVYKEIYK